MFACPDEHVHCLLEEIHSILTNVREHQLRITNEQAKTMDAAVEVLGKMVKRQGKMLKELKVNTHMRQIHYESTLNILAEQQRQMIEMLEKIISYPTLPNLWNKNPDRLPHHLLGRSKTGGIKWKSFFCRNVVYNLLEDPFRIHNLDASNLRTFERTTSY